MHELVLWWRQRQRLFFGGGEEGLIVVGAIQRGDVIVDICPELRLRRTGGEVGFTI